ncbi:MAG: hypothetical protein RL693_2358 [Verrucomicrobiota bacterium]
MTPSPLYHERNATQIRKQIVDGLLKKGDRIPGEPQLAKHFQVSRPTVARALKTLCDDHLLVRRNGSGTYVIYQAEKKIRRGPYVMGLLVPELGDIEIFEPIVQSIRESAQKSGHTLLHAESGDYRKPGWEKRILAVCREYLKGHAQGVFYAPIEGTPAMDATNQKVLRCFAEADVPVVLLDRDYEHFPRRSPHDLVGFDNFLAAFLLTEHLIRKGSRRIVFFAQPHSAATVDQRMTGWREACLLHHVPANSEPAIIIADPRDRVTIKDHLARTKPNGILCANDQTAALLLESLAALKIRVPEDIRVAGIDDARSAQLARVPLTTARQPCAAIGQCSFDMLLSRINHPDLPHRIMRLAPEMVFRQSTQ